MMAPLKTYVDLKTQLIADIAAGVYKPDERLPSQRELGKQYGLSHMSVRRAINELIAEGVIYTHPGKGLFVAEAKREAESGSLISFTEEMRLRGMRASTRLLHAEIIGASALLAKTLLISVGAPAVFLRRLRLADNEPMAVQTTYLPSKLCPGLLAHDLEKVSLFALLREHYGLEPSDAERSVEAVLATEEEAAHLQLPLPAALMVSEQITYLADGTPIEYVRSAYRGDRYRLRVEHPRHTGNAIKPIA